MLNDVWRSGDGGNSWTLLQSEGPFAPRSGHTMLATVCAPGASRVRNSTHTAHDDRAPFLFSEGARMIRG